LSSTPRVLVSLVAAIAVALSAPADAAGASKKAHAAPRAASSTGAKRSVSKAASRKAVHATRSRRSLPAIAIPVVDPGAVAHDAAAIAREFDGWLDEVDRSGGVAGLAAAVVKDDRVLLERGIGVADWSTGEPVTTETVFRLASLSKAFAAALTGLLVEEGRLHWDTKVADALPSFTLADVEDTQRLTVQDILSHRVGLPHNTYDRLLEQDEPYELLVDRLKDVPMACPVGACYGYQNIAFSMIGDVVFAATGDFYYHQVEKRIFHPLGMTGATYGRDALESSKSWARPHHHAGTGWASFVPSEAYYRVAPAAGVNASVRDIEQWLIAQMGGRPDVLSPALLETLHKPLVDTDRELRGSPWKRGRLKEAQYALGWRIYDYAGETLIFHAGAVQGYRAMIAFLPRYRFGAVMLWNCESGLPAGLMPMLFDRYLGLPEVNWAGIDRDDDATDVGSGGGSGGG
jgi:beta-lactamase class C